MRDKNKENIENNQEENNEKKFVGLKPNLQAEINVKNSKYLE